WDGSSIALEPWPEPDPDCSVESPPALRRLPLSFAADRSCWPIQNRLRPCRIVQAGCRECHAPRKATPPVGSASIQGSAYPRRLGTIDAQTKAWRNPRSTLPSSGPEQSPGAATLLRWACRRPLHTRRRLNPARRDLAGRSVEVAAR